MLTNKFEENKLYFDGFNKGQVLIFIKKGKRSNYFKHIKGNNPYLAIDKGENKGLIPFPKHEKFEPCY